MEGTKMNSEILSQLQKLSEKLDAIKDDTTELKVESARQCKDISRNADDLAVHMKRTALLEGRVTPLERHINMWAGAGKLLTIAGVLVGMAVTLYKIL